MTIKLNREGIPKLIIFFAVLLAIIGYGIYREGRRRAVPNIPEPVQGEADGGTVIEKNGYRVSINYKATYDIEALVVHTHNYIGPGLGNRLAPKDLALAWGAPAQYNDTIDFNWSQAARWYSWKCDSYEELIPIGGAEVVSRCSANNHVIPADAAVKQKIMKIRRGDHIRIKGYLVGVYGTKNHGNDTFTWDSSVTRDDTGDGACELIYATSVDILD